MFGWGRARSAAEATSEWGRWAPFPFNFRASGTGPVWTASAFLANWPKVVRASSGAIGRALPAEGKQPTGERIEASYLEPTATRLPWKTGPETGCCGDRAAFTAELDHYANSIILANFPRFSRLGVLAQHKPGRNRVVWRTGPTPV